MISMSSSQIPPPSNWQDFESLCCNLWTNIWGDKNAQKNGRSGQNQHGVDISGNDVHEGGSVCGVQCKGKDSYSNKVLSIDELESEVEKAKTYSPKLGFFIVATSGPKDQAVETRAREITEEHKALGLFSVTVFGWTDIVERMDRFSGFLEKHYPWLFNGNFSPDDAAFEFWKGEVNPESMMHYCNVLPFSDYGVNYSLTFDRRLQSYLQKFGDVMADFYKNTSNGEVFIALENFNKVATDVVMVCNHHESRELSFDIATYWVRDSHIPYYKKGDYIQYRKGVLRCLFYNLVKAANYVIRVYNQKLGSVPTSYIGFCDVYPTVFGEPIPSAEYYPKYSPFEMGKGILYPGLIAVDSHIRVQFYPGDSLC